MKIVNKWFPFGYAKKSHKKMVFCFHCAGGNTSFYREWTKNTKVDFVPIELPGRGRRISEPCSENIEELIQSMIVPILIASEGREYYFYGHSMGALLAFATAYRIKEKFNTNPKKLIVAGRTAPNHLDNARFKSYMNDEALIKELKRLNGTSEEILNNDEIMDFILPIIRNDYKLLESYNYNGEILEIPIIAHSGSDDYDASIEDMVHWSEVTKSICSLKEYKGDHFFVQKLGKDYEESIINVINT